jgi:hypothetical protein
MEWTQEEENEYQQLLKKAGGRIPGEDKSIENVEDLSSSWAKYYDNDVTKGINDAIKNMSKASYATVTGGEYEPSRSSEGTAYELAYGATNIAPWLIPATLPVRIASGIGAGYLLSPENPTEGAMDAAMWTAVGESIPFVGKAAKSVSDVVEVPDFVLDMTNQIKTAYTESKDAAYNIVKPIFDEYGGIKFKPEYTEQITSIFDGLGTKTFELNQFIDLFKKEPSLDNLQKLKSETGKLSRTLDPTDSSNIPSINELKIAESASKDMIKGAFDYVKPGSSKKYDEFSLAYALGPGQFEFSPQMTKLLESRNVKMTPKALESELKLGTQKTRKGSDVQTMPEEHYLREALRQVEMATAKSNKYSKGLNAASMIGGAGAGYSLFGPVGLAGAAVSQFTPSIAKFAMDPGVTEAVAKAYGLLRGGITGSVVAPENAIKVRSRFDNEESEGISQRGAALK